MDRRSGNRSKKTKTISKTEPKNRLEKCANIPMLGVRCNERKNNKIVTLGLNKVSVSPW